LHTFAISNYGLWVPRPLVLIADDDAVLRRAMLRSLLDFPLLVHWARDAQAAVSWLEEGNEPDLIVTNHWMPGMTGVELIAWVRAHRPEIRCVLHTGDDKVESDATILRKPLAPDVFRETILELARLS
jgi:CheY-like chemotaxis protein